jgi:hypothetical protein
LNYKKIEDSYNKKTLFLERKNQHLQAKYQYLLTKINNFNQSEFGNLIINHRQTLKNFSEKNSALNLFVNNINNEFNSIINSSNLAQIFRKNSLGINFILGAYIKPIETKTIIDKIKKNEEAKEEYSFIKNTNRKSKRNKKQNNNSDKKINEKTQRNYEKNSNSKSSKNNVYQFYHAEGEYNCNYSSRSNDSEDFDGKNKIKIKVSKKKLNKKSNFYIKENAKNNLISSERSGIKFSSDKNQTNLKIKRIQPLDSEETSFEFIKKDSSKTHRLGASNDKNLCKGFEDSAIKRNSLFSKRNLEDINFTKKEDMLKPQLNKADNIKIFENKQKILNTKNEIKKIEQINSNSFISAFDSEEASDLDHSLEKDKDNENFESENILPNEISFNKDSPIFKNNKKKSKEILNINKNENEEEEEVIKIKAKKKNIFKSFHKNKINYKRIFKHYHINYDEVSFQNNNNDNTDTNKSESQWNSGSFYYSNNFYFEDFEKQNNNEIKKKIIIPTSKLSAIKKIGNENLNNYSNNMHNNKYNKENNFNKNKNNEENTYSNNDYSGVIDFTLERESDDHLGFEGKSAFIVDDVHNHNKTDKNKIQRKNTLNLSPIMKQKNSDEVWNFRSFHP